MISSPVGYDVIISGIDTTEGLAEAKKAAASGQAVWAIPYDFIGSCEEGKEVCLGVPYFNWGPAYARNHWQRHRWHLEVQFPVECSILG